MRISTGEILETQAEKPKPQPANFIEPQFAGHIEYPHSGRILKTSLHSYNESAGIGLTKSRALHALAADGGNS